MKVNFRKADFKRAVEAAKSAGMQVARIDIDPTGKISLIPGNVAEAVGGIAVNEWDVTARHDAD
jgi:hypothetical protein